MSWDVSLVINTGIKEVQVFDAGNYTCNVAPMYFEAIGGEGLRSFDGLIANYVGLELGRVIEEMKRDPDKYEKMNPKNGWGNYEGAVRFLKKIREGCLDHPLATVRIY